MAMFGLSIEFHALPDELLHFTRECVTDLGLHTVAMQFFPFAAIEIPYSQLHDVFADASPYSELAFTLRPPEMRATTNREFARHNPGRLRLDVERPSDGRLRQCWLTCRTSQFEASITWKEVAKRLKAVTRTGVTAVNLDTGYSAPAPSYRYTEGAKRLAEKGTQMLPSVGGCILKFN
jgi:hypothetical protein